MRVKPKSLIWDTGEIIPALSVLSDPVLLGQSQAGQTVLSTLPVPPYMVIRSNLALLCHAELKSPTTDPSELILILFTADHMKLSYNKRSFVPIKCHKCFPIKQTTMTHH